MASSQPEVKYDQSFYDKAIAYLESESNPTNLEQEKVYFYVFGISQIYRFTPENEWSNYNDSEVKFIELYLKFEECLVKTEGTHVENQKISDNVIGQFLDYSNSGIYNGVVSLNSSEDCSVESKKYTKTIVSFIRYLVWRFWQIHVRDIIRKLDLSNKNKNTKLVIVAHTKNIENAKIWYESVVDDDLDGRVEMYVDHHRSLYKKVGFDWRFTCGSRIVQAMKMVYGKMWKEMDRQNENWEQNIAQTEEEGRSKNKPEDKMQDFLMRRFMANENPAQQGGDVVLDSEGKIVSIFQMANVHDRVSLKDLGLE